MTCYIVSIEPQTEESRLRVRDEVRTYPAFCPINRYCWAILSDKKATEIRDHISKVMENGERIFVVRSGTEAAWRNAYSDKNSAWLKKHL